MPVGLSTRAAGSGQVRSAHAGAAGPRADPARRASIAAAHVPQVGDVAGASAWTASARAVVPGELVRGRPAGSLHPLRVAEPLERVDRAPTCASGGCVRSASSVIRAGRAMRAAGAARGRVGDGAACRRSASGSVAEERARGRAALGDSARSRWGARARTSLAAAGPQPGVPVDVAADLTSPLAVAMRGFLDNAGLLRATLARRCPGATVAGRGARLVASRRPRASRRGVTGAAPSR